jgi:hypothetical protein
MSEKAQYALPLMTTIIITRLDMPHMAWTRIHACSSNEEEPMQRTSRENPRREIF